MSLEVQPYEVPKKTPACAILTVHNNIAAPIILLIIIISFAKYDFIVYFISIINLDCFKLAQSKCYTIVILYKN